MTEEKQKDAPPLRHRIWAAVFALALMPVTAYAESWVMSKNWEWFLQDRFGPGPSMGAWFGISTIFGLMIGRRLVLLAKDPSWDRPIQIVTTALVPLLVAPIAVGLSWCTGRVLGWI